MSCQKSIIDCIRDNGGNFIIELKANQKSLRYGLEDNIKTAMPTSVYEEDAALGHGRIESRTSKTFSGDTLIKDKEKWNGTLTVLEANSLTEKKSDGKKSSEIRLYLSSTDYDAERLSSIVRKHWSIEMMHWHLDARFQQDNIKRKHESAARNLDTIQKVVFNLIAIWKLKRKKTSDKRLGIAEIVRKLSQSFTDVMSFLAQK